MSMEEQWHRDHFVKEKTPDMFRGLCGSCGTWLVFIPTGPQTMSMMLHDTVSHSVITSVHYDFTDTLRGWYILAFSLYGALWVEYPSSDILESVFYSLKILFQGCISVLTKWGFLSSKWILLCKMISLLLNSDGEEIFLTISIDVQDWCVWCIEFWSTCKSVKCNAKKKPIIKICKGLIIN